MRGEHVVVRDDLDEVGVRRDVCVADLGTIDEIPARRLVIDVPANVS